LIPNPFSAVHDSQLENDTNLKGLRYFCDRQSRQSRQSIPRALHTSTCSAANSRRTGCFTAVHSFRIFVTSWSRRALNRSQCRSSERKRTDIVVLGVVVCVCGWLQAGCRGAVVGGTRQGFGCRVVGVFCMFE